MNLDLIMNFLEKGHSILVWIAGIGVPIMGYLKWRDGNQRFSQGRTKRLFDLMKKKGTGAQFHLVPSSLRSKTHLESI
ncbi:Uncharacterised protein [Burkholderia pseudomallei]|nr:Uncharacterised protein [Burkholderia pseudomallei]